MIYLGQSLRTIDGQNFPMTGALPLAFEMTPRLVQFGYAEIEFTERCLLGEKGLIVRGHSFHYSRLREYSGLPTSWRVQYSLSEQSEQEGFRYKNVLASYIHLHFRSNPALAPSFLAAVRRSRVAEAV